MQIQAESYHHLRQVRPTAPVSSPRFFCEWWSQNRRMNAFALCKNTSACFEGWEQLWSISTSGWYDQDETQDSKVTKCRKTSIVPYPQCWEQNTRHQIMAEQKETNGQAVVIFTVSFKLVMRTHCFYRAKCAKPKMAVQHRLSRTVTLG